MMLNVILAKYLLPKKKKKLTQDPSPSSYSPNIGAPTVPTLVLEDGQGLTDSFAIAEYLEEKYPDRPSLFGANPSEKNLQRFFESYVQSKLHPSIQRMVYEDMYNMQDDANAHYFRSSREKSSGRPYTQIAGDRAENLKELRENLGLIHTALRGGGWILGTHRKWLFLFGLLLILLVIL